MRKGEASSTTINQPTRLRPGWLLKMTLLYPTPLLTDMPRTNSTKNKRFEGRKT
ncbi:hypothetical protein TorRG33x02_016750 [Trema orientale]|uniref:Uncharacterized protein n=1 Tax=Trema orientale TaxID=63057 RepID=A0A2P5FY24_TREOI|nr:hypothetical protein TorRG33x02_016750 [Trema orientale]